MPPFVLLAATTLLLVAGCTSSGDSAGGDGGDGGTPGSKSPSATPSPTPKGPACADVWKAGETLPKDYTACVKAGAYGEQDVTKCKDGTKLVAFDDAYYAITGGPINKPDVAPMQDTPEFGKAYTACTGE